MELMKEDAGLRPPYPGAPRWVKMLGFATLALVVTFVIVHLAGGGFRHHGSIHHEQSARGDEGR
jgi:thiosulfate reductase cytochrome b subunit